MGADATTQNTPPVGEGLRPTKAEVYGMLDTLPLGCVATVDQTGQPQVATVGFSQTKDLEFIFGTKDTAHKALNIMHDGRVGFVATDTIQRYTVQLEGRAKKLEPAEFDAYAENHFRKLPAAAPYRDVEGQCFIIIRPYRLRFSDCSVWPWVVTEFAFDE